MSKKYKIAAKGRKNKFADNLSLNDAESYEFDFSAWQEDNNTITSATWTVESGQVSITNEALASGVASALLTFSEQGKSLVSVLVDTGTEKKQIWLEVYAKNYEDQATDYGI
jgi:hypothetical protein